MTVELRTVTEEMAGLHKLLAALQAGKVVTHLGYDVTAREIAKLQTMLAYLEVILYRLNHSVH